MVALSCATYGSFWPGWVETLAVAPGLVFPLLRRSHFKVAVKEMSVVAGVPSLELWERRRK